ncbi:MAG: DUF2945 domain-containing protein [Pseudomonadota bacterium]
MSQAYNKGDKVEWDWGDGVAKGEVTEVYTADVSKTIKGTEVTRNATGDCPAYGIKQSDGDVVLKSQTEIRKASS